MAVYFLLQNITATQSAPSPTNPPQKVVNPDEGGGSSPTPSSVQGFQVIVTSTTGTCSATVQIFAGNDGVQWNSFGSPIVVATAASPASAIGTAGGSPSATQNAAGSTGMGWSMSGGGAGLDGTADNAYACSVPVSGSSIDIRAKITAMTTPATYNKAAIQQVAKQSATAKKMLAITAAKKIDDARLRPYAATDLADNPGLLKALGIDIHKYEQKVAGE